MRPEPDPRSWRPALGLALVGVALCYVFRVLPGEYRFDWNFAPVGALAIFAAARLPLAWALGVVLLAHAGTDLILYAKGGQQAVPAVYLGLLGYMLVGRLAMARSRSVARSGAAAFAGGWLFFLVTNTASWWEQALPYPLTFAGWLEALAAGVPFHKGTLLSDMIFTPALFAAHAVFVARAARTQIEEARI